MRFTGKQTKCALSVLLCLLLVVSSVAFALTVQAEEVDGLAETGAATYYLYGAATDTPDFSAMTEPTGNFSFDSSKGYYFDLEGAEGDYCFVISEAVDSGFDAVSAPAVTTVADGASYFVTAEKCNGYDCMHLLNPSGDKLRISFTAPEDGIVVAALPDEAPTQAEVTQAEATKTVPDKTDLAQTGADKVYVYCENEAAWGSVYAYMWNKATDGNSNASWPGVKMTNTSGNIWRYEVTNSKWDMIIFNIGSSATQTGNMDFPGNGYIYNNKTQQWSIYDTSPLQVTSFTTDVESPQYNGVGITLSATAEGKGTVSYKFSVSNGSSTTVLKDYSTVNQVQWIPQVAGTYTLTYEFKDAAGNTNKRTKQYVIEDGLSSVSPYIKTVTPNGGEIQKNKACSVSVSAGGGFTGTKLLFYKFTVKDSSGNIVNTPYYTLNSNYSFTPTALGAYTVTVDVQGSDNKTVERTYSYNSVGTVTPTENPATEPPTEQPTEHVVIPTESPVPVLYGDADGDGEIIISDVTYIQRYEVDIPLPTPLNFRNADVDGDGEVVIMDATLVQRYIAGIIERFPVEN